MRTRGTAAAPRYTSARTVWPLFRRQRSMRRRSATCRTRSPARRRCTSTRMSSFAPLRRSSTAGTRAGGLPMGNRITDVASEEFGALFTGFSHTAYRLETLQEYDVSYEEEPYRAFLEGAQRPHDPAKDDWTTMIRS